jgi:hypothetical protein
MAGGAVRHCKSRSSRGVHRIIRLLPGCQMAAGIPAIGGRNRQRIVVIEVAQIAGHIGVPVGQREPGRVMVKHSRGPGSNRVTSRARRSCDRESRSDVVGHRPANGRRALESRLVAAVTIRRVQSVVVADVAGRAGCRSRRHMRAGQRKACRAVIKRCGGPANRRVAGRTIPDGEGRSRCRVHRIVRLLPGREVASRVSAIGRRDRQIVVVVDVAQIAGHVRVPIGQQKPGRAVIKCGGCPTGRRVAGRTICKRKCRAGRWVDGIGGRLPGRQMASGISAIVWSDRQIVVVVDVAERAGNIRMAIGQQEPGRAVVEFGVQPGVKRMAGFACGGKLRGNMIRINCFLKIRQVAGGTGSGKTQVIPDGWILVALIALQDGVRTEQGKSVEVLLNGLHRHLPAEHGVALGAVFPELGAVNVGVAIRTILSNVGKDRLGMASRAGHFFVHASQRVPRGVVIEFGNGANGRPACIRVTILAGNDQWPVRTSARLPLGVRRAAKYSCQNQQHEPTSSLYGTRNDCPLML